MNSDNSPGSKGHDEALLSKITGYYEGKLREHGSTPAGVDWNGVESQILRFSQLAKIIPLDNCRNFSIVDLGCGYAALFDYLKARYSAFSYTGYDISQNMCNAAQDRLIEESNINLRCSEAIDECVDYGIASGIFSVKLDVSDSILFDHICSVLDNLNDKCTKGFSFNCLTSYSDKHKMRPDLYYANPAELFQLCMSKYSKHVALLHDYGLYEFTILVRK